MPTSQTYLTVGASQHDLGMEYPGHRGPSGYDRVVAGMNVNVWDVAEPIQRLIRTGASVDERQLSDTHIALDELGAARDGAA